MGDVGEILEQTEGRVVGRVVGEDQVELAGGTERLWIFVQVK